MARPKSHINNLKLFQVNIRLTLEEQLYVENQAKLYGISAVEYVRKRSLNKQLPKIAMATVNRELLISLSKIGNNLNQLTRKANQNIPFQSNLSYELHQLNELLNHIKNEILK